MPNRRPKPSPDAALATADARARRTVRRESLRVLEAAADLAGVPVPEPTVINAHAAPGELAAVDIDGTPMVRPSHGGEMLRELIG